MSLHHAIPIPTRNVALQDLLEFKQKRNSELEALRKELDSYKQLITSATDRAEVLATQRDRIDAACVDLLSVSREQKMPIHISDMSLEIDFNGSAALVVAAAASVFSDHLNLPGVEKFLASAGVIALSSIKFKAGFGIGDNKAKLRQSPFRYVHYLNKELDWL